MFRFNRNLNDPNQHGDTPLIAAVLARDLKKVKWLIKKNVNVNVGKRYGGDSALYLAIKHDYPEIVNELLMHDQIDVNIGSYLGPPLYIAIQKEKPNYVIKLLNKGADISIETIYCKSLLLNAVIIGSAAIVRLLLHAGADYNVQHPYLGTPLKIAADRNYFDIVKLLFEAGAKIDKVSRKILYKAAERGEVDLVKVLIAAKVNVNSMFSEKKTALAIAVENNHVGVVKALLASKKTKVNKARSNDLTPLHRAVVYGSIEIVEALLTNPRIRVNAVCGDGITALYLAAERNDIKVVEMLLAVKKIKVNTARSDGAAAIHIAVYRGHVKIVAALFADPNININAAMRNAATALFIAAKHNHLEILKLLVAAGADLNATNFLEITPILAATQENHYEIVRTLLDAGADVVNCKLSKNPLYIAAEHRWEAGTRLFLTKGLPEWITKNPNLENLSNYMLEIAQFILETHIQLNTEKSYATSGIRMWCRDDKSYFSTIPKDPLEFIIAPMVSDVSYDEPHSDGKISLR